MFFKLQILHFHQTCTQVSLMSLYFISRVRLHLLCCNTCKLICVCYSMSSKDSTLSWVTLVLVQTHQLFLLEASHTRQRADVFSTICTHKKSIQATYSCLWDSNITIVVSM